MSAILWLTDVDMDWSVQLIAHSLLFTAGYNPDVTDPFDPKHAGNSEDCSWSVDSTISPVWFSLPSTYPHDRNGSIKQIRCN